MSPFDSQRIHEFFYLLSVEFVRKWPPGTALAIPETEEVDGINPKLFGEGADVFFPHHGVVKKAVDEDDRGSALRALDDVVDFLSLDLYDLSRCLLDGFLVFQVVFGKELGVESDDSNDHNQEVKRDPHANLLSWGAGALRGLDLSQKELYPLGKNNAISLFCF